jgi:hypothetical protein
LFASVGTAGLGRGTFLGLRYAEVPPAKHPVALIEFPARRPGRAPLAVKLDLNERC